MYKNYDELGTQPQRNIDHYSITEISNSKHKQDILTNNRIVCIDIYADWCGPCKQIAPDYAMMAKNYNKPGYCQLVKEDFNKHLSENIHGVPTFRIFVDGQQVDEVVGADLEEVEKKLIKQLEHNNNSGPIRYDSDAYSGQPRNIPQYAQANLPNTQNGPQYGRNTIRQHTQNSLPSAGQNYVPPHQGIPAPMSRGGPPQPSQGQPYQGGQNGARYHQLYQNGNAPQHQNPQSHQYNSPYTNYKQG